MRQGVTTIEKSSPIQRLRFGSFEATPSTGELRKHGVRLKLHNQPFQVLAMLLERPGELVTREEIQRKLWPSGTFVDFENGLNSAVNRLRDVLGDSADQPRFIETIPRQGYRFLPDVVSDQINNAHPAKIDHRPANNFQTEASTFSPLQDISPTRTSWNLKLSLVAMALFIIAIGPSVLRSPGGSTPAAATLVDQKLHPLPLVTYGDGAQWLPAFSPDGSRIAYSWATAAGWYLEVKQIGSDTRVRLTKTAAKFPPGPTWSPDGKRIAYVRADALDDRGIFIISAMGGPERKLRSLAPWRVPQRMVNWSPDSKWIAFSDEYEPEKVQKTKPRGPNAIYLISPETLETRRLTDPGEDFGDSAPAFSPDGTTIAFVHTTADSHDQICTVPVAGGTPRIVVTEGLWTNGLTWTADGKSLVFDRSFAGGFSIWRAPASGGQLRRLDLSESRGNLLEPTLWHDSLAYEAHDSVRTVSRIPLNSTKSEIPQTPVASTRSDRAGRYSPKGDRIAFISDRTGKEELWIADVDGSNTLQLTHLETTLSDIAWAPDGKFVAVSAMLGNVFLVSVETGESRLVFTGPAFTDETSSNLAFSRNGQFLYVVSQPGTGDTYELLKVPLLGGAPERILDGIITNVSESPDGKTIFYSLAGSLTNRNSLGVWRRPTQGGAAQFVANAPGLWDIGARGLYIESGSKTIERYNLSGKHLQTMAKLRPFAFHSPMSISPDGLWALLGYEPRQAIEIDVVRGID